MLRLRLTSPGHPVTCDVCGEDREAISICKVGEESEKFRICGRCLALALQEVTKQNWLSQYVLWQANKVLGEQIQERKRVTKALRQINS